MDSLFSKGGGSRPPCRRHRRHALVCQTYLQISYLVCEIAFYAYFSMDVWFVLRVACATIVALKMSQRGLAKKSLDASGASAAFFVGFFALASSWRCGICLLVFYFSSSRVTKLGKRTKEKLEGVQSKPSRARALDTHATTDEFREGGQRNACRVYTNSLPAVLAAVAVCARTFLSDGLVAEQLPVDFHSNPEHAALCCVCIL